MREIYEDSDLDKPEAEGNGYGCLITFVVLLLIFLYAII